jgi:hypothetical protein
MFFSGLLFFSSLLFAQSIETFKTMKFGEPIDFWTKWDGVEGGAPGIYELLVPNSEDVVLYDSEKNEWLLIDTSNKVTVLEEGYSTLEKRGARFSAYIKNGYIVGFAQIGKEGEYKITVSDWKIGHYKTNILLDSHDYIGFPVQLYYTSENLFFQTEKKDLISIELLSDGTNKVRGADETKSWLESGKGEEIGYKQELYENGQISDNYIGDIIVRTASNYYRTPVTTNVKMLSDKYSELTRMKDTGYSNLGKDGKGLVYYRKLEDENGLYNSDHPGKNIKFNIAVIDIWTRQVYFYEDYAANEWNPPRNSEGKVIGSYAWTVAPDGSIYFADADTEKGEYQIKRIPNRWYKDMGMEGRTIGQMNANHIPLAEEASAAAQNDGYCFENDFVWVKETKGAWSRIQKIDGRTGWVESKYIDIE